MRRAWILAAAALLFVGAPGLLADENDAKPGEVKTGLKVGQKAPEFKIADANGKLIDAGSAGGTAHAKLLQTIVGGFGISTTVGKSGNSRIAGIL